MGSTERTEANLGIAGRRVVGVVEDMKPGWGHRDIVVKAEPKLSNQIVLGSPAK